MTAFAHLPFEIVYNIIILRKKYYNLKIKISKLLTFAN